MAQVTIYTWTVCPYCVRAKSLLKSKGVDYNEINLDGKDDELKKLQERTKWRTVPQIFIGDEFIGGYVDLAELETRGELDQLLAKNS
ncbi:MAG: glutaredoxin 3 [Bdellovibrionales bacterium]